MFYLERLCVHVDDVKNSFMSREVVANYTNSHHTPVNKNNVPFNYNFLKIKVVSVCVNVTLLANSINYPHV